VIYRHQDWRQQPFNIEVSTPSYFNKVKYIAVNNINGDDMIVPNMNNRTYGISNSTNLIINPTDYDGLYIINITFEGDFINLLVRKDGPLILTGFLEHSQKIQKNQVMSYKIYTANSILLFITTNSQHPQVTINKNYNMTKVFSTTVTSKSNTPILIPSLHS